MVSPPAIPSLPRPSTVLSDALGLAAVLVVTVVATWPLVVGGTVVGQDTAAFFYPVFVALGDRLVAGDVPGWNPHQFAGVPFAADPESGWMYLPAMLLFALLPVAAAAKGWMLFHFLLAGLGTYALGRVLGLGALGGLTAALAYELSGLLYARTVCCPAYSQVAAWLPALLLVAEMAARSRGWGGRLGWWSAGGVALAHVFVAWLGQGSYYVLLAFGGFIVYRTAVAPPWRHARAASRLAATVLHGSAPVIIGLGLSAAAVLPRFAYAGRTNLANGYTGDLAWAARLGGWDLAITIDQLLNRSFYYVGGATFSLAIVAMIRARGRHAAPFFAALAAGALVLAQREPTWLHRPLFALLPRFEELHRHWPERDMVVFFLGPAMLAGIGVHTVASGRGPRWVLALAALLPTALMAGLSLGLAPIAGTAARSAAAVGFLLLALGSPFPRARRAATAILPLVVAADLLAMGRDNLDHGLYGGFHKLDLDAYYAPSPAAAYLQNQSPGGAGPSRFFGYDPGVHPGDRTPPLYRYFFPDPRATALLVNNRATALGLEDVQGYNPVQPRRYVEYMRALNGFAQEYHEANVYPAGLDSPLLDLLNARHVVVPAIVPPDRPDLRSLVERWPQVFADDSVRILENPGALPRAWIVHEARQVAPGEALPLLASGAVDPSRVALVEEAPPELLPPVDSAVDRATLRHAGTDRLAVAVNAAAPGLLVLSETVDPDWRAEVDGEPAPILTANHLFRAVPIPAGDHLVELRYDSRTLAVGSAVSLVSYAGIVTSWLAVFWRRRRGAGRR